MLVAQISDLHVSLPGTPIDVHYHTADRLERAVAHLLRLDPRPEAVVVTGDLVDGGRPAEYERLLGILAPLPMPIFATPGNHDEREAMRSAFRDRGYLPERGFLCYEAEVGPLRILSLDTNVPGEPGGRLCRERLAWLDARLGAAPDRPTILIQHHPPFPTGLGPMDAMGLDGGEEEARVVAGHRQVERILCGHVHRAIQRRFAGTIASTCPSTSHQIELDLRQRGRLALVSEPPACTLHLWREDTGLVSHLSYIEDHGVSLVIAEAG